MKIYLVSGSGYDGSSIGQIYTRKEDALKHAEIMNKFKYIDNQFLHYKVIEKEVKENFLMDLDLSLCCVYIKGYINLKDIDSCEIREIKTFLARDWCIGNFDNLDDLIFVDLYYKTDKLDFDLNEDELKEKYKYIWEDIISICKSNIEKTVEEIVELIRFKYEISWVVENNEI